VSISRAVKGKRPVFVIGDTDANLNRLLAMISALSAEVAVLRDRQRTLEQILAQRGDLKLSDIEAFEPDAKDLAERAQWQADFLRRVHYILESEAEEVARKSRE
jgi:two-component SAPR family response regulator